MKKIKKLVVVLVVIGVLLIIVFSCKQLLSKSDKSVKVISNSTQNSILYTSGESTNQFSPEEKAIFDSLANGFKNKTQDDFVIPPFFVIKPSLSSREEGELTDRLTFRQKQIYWYLGTAAGYYYAWFGTLPTSNKSFVDNNIVPFYVSNSDIELIDSIRKKTGWPVSIDLLTLRVEEVSSRKIEDSTPEHAYTHIRRAVFNCDFKSSIGMITNHTQKSFEADFVSMLKYLDETMGINPGFWEIISDKNYNPLPNKVIVNTPTNGNDAPELFTIPHEGENVLAINLFKNTEFNPQKPWVKTGQVNSIDAIFF